MERLLDMQFKTGLDVLLRQRQYLELEETVLKIVKESKRLIEEDPTRISKYTAILSIASALWAKYYIKGFMEYRVHGDINVEKLMDKFLGNIKYWQKSIGLEDNQAINNCINILGEILTDTLSLHLSQKMSQTSSTYIADAQQALKSRFDELYRALREIDTRLYRLYSCLKVGILWTIIFSSLHIDKEYRIEESRDGTKKYLIYRVLLSNNGPLDIMLNVKFSDNTSRQFLKAFERRGIDISKYDIINCMDAISLPEVTISIIPTAEWCKIGSENLCIPEHTVMNPLVDTLYITVRCNANNIEYLLALTTRNKQFILQGKFTKKIDADSSEDLKIAIDDLYSILQKSHIGASISDEYVRLANVVTNLLIPRKLFQYLSGIMEHMFLGNIIFLADPYEDIPNTDISLAEIPWELMTISESNIPLGIVLPVTRQLLSHQFDYSAPAYIESTNSSLIIGDLRGDLPSARREAVAIKSYLESLGILAVMLSSDEISKSSAPRNEIRGSILMYRPQIIHVASHIDIINDEPYLLLPREKNMHVREFLNCLRTPAVVYLNTCSPEKKVYVYLAKNLAYGKSPYEEKIQNVIGITLSTSIVNDVLAKEFSIVFYNNLIQGKNIGISLLEARRHLYRKYGGIAWSTWIFIGNPLVSIPPSQA